MLSPQHVVRYLLGRKLLSNQAIVEGELTIVDTARRNRNFQVESTKGPSYFLKQGVGSEKGAMVAHEADIYQYLMELAAGTAFFTYLPAFQEYDRECSILCLEMIPQATTLREYHVTHRSFPVRFGRALGTALGALHRLTATTRHTNERQVRPAPEPPWILTSLHRPHLRVFREISSANVQLIKILQQSAEFCDLLDELCGEWRRDALIHGDLKMDNCLIFGQSGSTRFTRLKIVDWEFAGLGDPLWDAGTVLSEYLSLWLHSIPVAGTEPVARNLHLALHPLERMQPLIRAFWRAWESQVRPVLGDDPDKITIRAVRYSAARLVQSAYEQMQDATQLTGNIICLLQVSLNVLKSPRNAAAQLLGLPILETSPS